MGRESRGEGCGRMEKEYIERGKKERKIVGRKVRGKRCSRKHKGCIVEEKEGRKFCQ